MLRLAIYPTLLLLAACGGGGGAAGVATPARLASQAIEFLPTTTATDLVVSLVDLPDPAPVLLQVAIDLPAALAVAPNDPLQAIQAVETLRGSQRGSRFTVVCGDDRHPTGTPLASGELFRLRLVTTTPRQVGSHLIRLNELTMAQSDGTAAPIDNNPVSVTAVVR